MFDNIKGILGQDHIFYSLVLVLVSSLSFGLGRWSVEKPLAEETGPEIRIEEAPRLQGTIYESTPSAALETATPDRTMSDQSTISSQEHNFVASRKGTKYHLPSCPGAKQMSAENQIWFATKEEAERFGYTPAANCPGLSLGQ